MLYLNDHIAEMTEAEVLAVVETLPPWRREKALRFAHLAGRRECAMAYVELLRGLRLEHGIEEMPRFDYGEHGRPFLPDHPAIHFSLSHCREAVGCLIDSQPCGLDIERIRHATPSLVRHCMSPAEEELIGTADKPDLAFTRLWTRKEAVFKLRGTGICGDIRTLLSRADDLIISTWDNPARGYVVSQATLRR